jgi:hypothetical protein
MDNETESYIRNLILQWQVLINKPIAPEHLTESQLMLYINNRDIILGYEVTFNFDVNDYIVTEVTDARLKYLDSQKLDLLEEYYNKKYLTEVEHLRDNTKYSYNQKFYLLEKIGLLDLHVFKADITNEKKHMLIAKILGCDTRTAKGLFNSEVKYTCTPENAEIVDKFIKDNKLI